MDFHHPLFQSLALPLVLAFAATGVLRAMLGPGAGARWAALGVPLALLVGMTWVLGWRLPPGSLTEKLPWVFLAAALLGAGLVSTLLLWFAPRRATVALFRAVMVLCVVIAAAGLYFHYQANLEFVLERHPDYRGRQFFKEAMTGAMPALAPGTMAQLGLMGLAATLRLRSA